MRRVNMRSLALLVLTAATAACTSPAAPGSANDTSVRERLARGRTRLYIAGSDSTGSVTARRWTPGGWIAGDMPIVIDNGELSATVDAAGRLKLDAFEVGIVPIEIPEDVFKSPAQLTDVRIKLTAPTTADAAWTTSDDATTTLAMTLDLQWAIAIGGTKTPLGSQHLPPVNVGVTLGGDGDVVDATLGLAANGELWNWAGIIQMTHLEMSLGAATVD